MRTSPYLTRSYPYRLIFKVSVFPTKQHIGSRQNNRALCEGFLVKLLKYRYGLKIAHFSTHSLRKTFGRRVVEMAGANSEMALIKLSDIFQHSSVKTTRIYLGLRKEELMDTYDQLEM